MKTMAQAGSRITCALTVLLAGLGIAPLAPAGTNYAWTSTGPSATGYWTNNGNWNPSSNFPGNATGDSAYFTNAAANAYTSILNASPANALTTLSLSNSLGTAWLVVTQGVAATTCTVTTLTLGNGGGLELDAGGMVNNTTTTAFTWSGTNWQVRLNNGGALATSANVTLSNKAAIAALITNAAAPLPGGVWNFGGKTLTVTGGGTGSGALTASGVTLTNLGLVVGLNAAANQDTLLVTDGAQLFVPTGTSAVIGKSGASSNTVTVAGTNALLGLTGIALTVGDTSSGGNVLVVTNGAQAALGSGGYVGSNGSNNTMVVSGTGSVLSVGTSSFFVGYGTAGNGNLLRIENGGIVTNSACQCYVGAGPQGPPATAGGGGNSLIVTNGGQFWNSANYDLKIGIMAYSNTAWIGGHGALISWGGRNFYCGSNGATGNVAVVDNGGSLISCSTLFVGRGTGNAGNSMIITNGGQVVLSTSAEVSYNGTNTLNNVVLVVNGGLLEAPLFEINYPGNAFVGGNCITNSGGIYQFNIAAPVIHSYSNSMVYLTSGTISFRAITNADVRCANLFNTNNMSWSGTNAFRLNNATNTASANQSYTFDSTGPSTNYARLEMINGGTRYRGQVTNSLTIGAYGQMLCSNTTAVVDLAFTNNGTLTLVNSTLSFATNAALNGTLAIDLNNLATNTGVVAAARNLTLGSTHVLTLTGAGTNVTLITYAGTLDGSFGTENLPPGCQINYGTRNNSAISLKLVPMGSVILLR